ncbi:thiamine pyrophosphate-dependent dehydrogenase E1 component subunit alpha [Pyramidobacter piscolens]|uniref:thiamine pyrophosphate-dependent dehydrogenase E1 component subunit alpha n=1 Tax=Pyramidobacter piscolens TaxID=638849 RepID=UPI0024463DF8|nr:thiamine pyrophosphate-dependent dehydrogenase E1 component subunit alpha [Pyramidobacter piscolens]BDF79095.1 pyruvate dehydrogenase E1 component subunit alpha [Pyramidobacter piscolens]
MSALAIHKEPTVPVGKYSKKLLTELYGKMVTIRLFEQTVESHFLAGEIPGFVHLYIGEEAIAAGIMANLTNRDYIESTHRGHGHTIAKGADLKRMMAEIFGKATGYCKGKGGSMHIADFSIGMLGANGIVGGGYTLAVGAGLATKLSGEDKVSVVFFGDGASNRGTFHEALNMAAIWQLPVLFVCEMNQWASTTPYRTTTSVENIADRCQGYSIPGYVVDGNDVLAVYEAAKDIVADIRAGKGPALLECKTYRIKGHFVGDPEKYRTKEEVQHEFETNNPITRFEEKVLKAGALTQADLDAVYKQAEQEIAEALKFAKESPEPAPEAIYEDLYV